MASTKHPMRRNLRFQIPPRALVQLLDLTVFQQYITENTATLKSLSYIFLIFISYTSMSILSRFLRPFTTMSNAPAQPMNVPSGAQTATVAAGCFWGVEHMYRKAFANKGLLDARVGYIGGDSSDPSYRAVCSGRTGRRHSPFPPEFSLIQCASEWRLLTCM